MNIYTPILFSFLFLFCTKPVSKEFEINTSPSAKKTEKHQDFNAYWYAGKAEITSYRYWP